MNPAPVGKARTGRGTSARVLLAGALALSLACGEAAAPVYPRLTIATTALPNASPNVAYVGTLVAAGGDGSYTWLLTAGALPAGLSLADSTGVISGTPTGSSSTFTVRAASGDGQTATQQLLIYVFDVLTVTTTSLPLGSPGAAYREVLAAAGGDGSYTWSITDGSLPPGLSLDASTGVISGTPSEEGRDAFTVQVASGDGQTAARQLVLTVPPFLQPDEACADYPDYAIVSFEDAALAAAVRSALSVNEPDELTCGVASQLDSLSAEHAGIASLAGMQNLTGLTLLHLGFNSIADVSPLSGLTNLADLYLHRNAISDLTPLRALTRLRALLFYDNSTDDIGALRGLTLLWFLDLSGNAITDLSPLSGLTNLMYLYLRGNAISDIDVLSGLTRLRYLSLGGNAISDLGPLSGLTSMEYLGLSGNAISDLGPLSRLTRVWRLELADNAIIDLSALSGLWSVSDLDLRGNTISDLGPLRGLTSLAFLYLDDNPTLADIQPLLDNTGLGAGDNVRLGGTSVSCTDVAALQAKGVFVASDCP